MLEFFGDNWGWIVAGASGLSAAFIKSGLGFIKHKLSGDVATRIERSISREIGEENTQELKGIIKTYGVKKLVAMVSAGFNRLEQKEDKIYSLLYAIANNQNKLGVYDDNPEIKKLVEELLNE